MKLFQSFHESIVSIYIVAFINSITIIAPNVLEELHNEIALAVLQFEKEDKRKVTVKATHKCFYHPTSSDPIYFIC